MLVQKLLTFDFYAVNNFLSFFFLRYEYVWILFCAVKFKVGFFFFFFVSFFFKKVNISFLYEWAILSYNYDHVICIYLLLFYFILFFCKFDYYISFIYINSVLWLGVFLGGQWALYAYRWGFYWNRDIIEYTELLFIFLILKIIHVKKSFHNFFCIMIDLYFILLLMLLMRRGFIKSIHNFFNKLLINDSYYYINTIIIIILNIIRLLVIFCYILIFFNKFLFFFLPYNHVLLFWVLFLLTKFCAVKKLFYCIFVVNSISYTYFYVLRCRIGVFFFFFKVFIYNVWYDFFSLMYNYIDHIEFFIVYISYSLFLIAFGIFLVFFENYV
jgi:hypothetical protein